jgi:hypothetical protein
VFAYVDKEQENNRVRQSQIIRRIDKAYVKAKEVIL